MVAPSWYIDVVALPVLSYGDSLSVSPNARTSNNMNYGNRRGSYDHNKLVMDFKPLFALIVRIYHDLKSSHYISLHPYEGSHIPYM